MKTNEVKFSRSWAMPSSLTFSIKPIKLLIERYMQQGQIVVDPFANNSKYGTITNDLDPDMDTDYHMDALDFLSMLGDNSADLVLYDPPYSSRQVSEVYKKLGHSVNMETTQSSYWSKQKEQIKRIVKPGGIVVSFGWNTQGIGKKRGFEIEEILIVAHGGAHHDTLCTVERKVRMINTLFDYDKNT